MEHKPIKKTVLPGFVSVKLNDTLHSILSLKQSNDLLLITAECKNTASQMR